jgi:uncharacterized protein (DUF3084 family)
MSDERINEQLQEELRSAHNKIGQLLEESDKNRADIEVANAIRGELSVRQGERDKAVALRIAAEQNAAAAQRKLRDAENKIRNLEDENEKLTDALAVAREQAGKLADLDGLIESAKHSGDLFAA